jgi:hypothetical protein
MRIKVVLFILVSFLTISTGKTPIRLPTIVENIS